MIKPKKYSLKKFFKEVEKLSKWREIPTRNFCYIFLERLDTEAANDAGYYNDSEDYHAWGLALFDDVDTSGEDFVHRNRLFDWVEFYERLDQNQPHQANAILQEILEDWPGLTIKG